MSKLNFENIDRWLFEFTEGNLTDEQESHLFDFLELHPELMPEFKAWSSAKIKAPAQTEFSSEHLIKSAPFLLRPFSLVGIGFLAFVLAWLGYGLIPSTPIYTMEDIDAEIIETETEQTDLYVDQLLALSNKKNLSTDFQDKEVDSKAIKTPIKNINSSSDNSNSPINWSRSQTAVIDQASSNDHLSDVERIIQTDEYSHFIAKNQNTIEDQYLAVNNQSQVISSDFEIISDYLREKDRANTNLKIDSGSDRANDFAHNKSKKTSKSTASKSSFKKTLSSTFRKIKRMADYPVAMQNTKNPNFHTPMMSGYDANIAMVGSASGNRIQATSRMQWLNESNSQLMNTISYDGYVYALRGGVGVDVNYNNYQGNDISNYSTGLTYSPKFSVNKKISFEPAIRLKMGVLNLDQQSSSIGNSIELDRRNIVSLFEDEKVANGQQLWYRDMGLGFMLNTKWFYAGFNADNIGRHYNNYYSSNLDKEYKSSIHYTAIMGTEYVAKTRQMRISGYALFQNYGDLNELWLGSNFQYNWLQIGIGVSSNADLASSLGVIFKQFSLHYNVDYTESRLLAQQNISHQISMRFLLKPSRNAARFLKR
ncbi:type IX secretion system membrane protein PorP/SprF [Brumimicrobium mesophilum]|uniref:type IX secretion system membrane protein PorP/SprF n=1 Tax=Brumimicrobium mesophilum TaxID=392717 RepID=UPI000D143DFA|nr:type IX secretion system membrane protein PorP/SprF [Brumimicrobium mesophilum]